MNAKLRRALFFALAVVFLATTSVAIDPLHSMREKYGLTNRPVEGLSPQLALTTQVLSWARGIIIDVLWIRMDALKDQGRHYELVQLADWACKLAPHIPQVWDIQAWNMAYNVSVQVDFYPDRWAWVQAGIELLRDQAIPTNPDAPLLYQRLASLILHKIGQSDDNAHAFYKNQFALMMHRTLDGSGDRETLKRFAEAPRTRRELLQHEQVKKLVQDCRRFDFDIVEDYYLWYDDAPEVPRELKSLLERPYHSESLRKIGAFVRAKTLRQEHKLEPELMIELVDKYGPFDWRTPYPHAIYWAHRGLEKIEKKEEMLNRTVEEFGLEEPRAGQVVEHVFGGTESIWAMEKVNMEATIYAALQELVHNGRFQFGPNGRLLVERGTDYRFADALLEFYDEAFERWPIRYRGRIASALRFFLITGIVEFHFMGDNQKAMAYFGRLKERFPTFVAGRSYEQFVDERVKKYVLDMSFEELRNLVRNLFYRAFVAMGCGDDETAAVMERKAQAMADRYGAENADDLREKVRIERLRDGALVNILTGRVSLPDEVLANLKARLGPEKVQNVLERVGRIRGEQPLPEDIPERLKFQSLLPPEGTTPESSDAE